MDKDNIPDLTREDLKEQVDIVKKAFAIYDADGSGSLDADELEELLNEVCECLGLPNIYQAQLKECILILDSDGDGDIDYKEIVRNLPKLNHVLRNPDLMYNFEEEESEDDPDDPKYHKKNPKFIKGLGRKFLLIETLQNDQKKDNNKEKDQKKEEKDKNALSRSVLDLLNKKTETDNCMIKIANLMNGSASNSTSQCVSPIKKHTATDKSPANKFAPSTNFFSNIQSYIKEESQQDSVMEMDSDQKNINHLSFKKQGNGSQNINESSISIIDDSKTNASPTKLQLQMLSRDIKGKQSSVDKIKKPVPHYLDKQDLLKLDNKISATAKKKFAKELPRQQQKARERLENLNTKSVQCEKDFINYIHENKLKTDSEHIQNFKQDLDIYIQSQDKEQYFQNCESKKIYTLFKNTKQEKIRLQNIIMNLDIFLANGSKFIKKNQIIREEAEEIGIRSNGYGVPNYFQVDIKKEESSIVMPGDKAMTKEELTMETIKKKIIDDLCYTKIDPNFFSKSALDERIDLTKYKQHSTKSFHLPPVINSPSWYDFKTGKRQANINVHDKLRALKEGDFRLNNLNLIENNSLILRNLNDSKLISDKKAGSLTTKRNNIGLDKLNMNSRSLEALHKSNDHTNPEQALSINTTTFRKCNTLTHAIYSRDHKYLNKNNINLDKLLGSNNKYIQNNRNASNRSQILNSANNNTIN